MQIRTQVGLSEVKMECLKGTLHSVDSATN